MYSYSRKIAIDGEAPTDSCFTNSPEDLYIFISPAPVTLSPVNKYMLPSLGFTVRPLGPEILLIRLWAEKVLVATSNTETAPESFQLASYADVTTYIFDLSLLAAMIDAYSALTLAKV